MSEQVYLPEVVCYCGHPYTAHFAHGSLAATARCAYFQPRAESPFVPAPRLVRLEAWHFDKAKWVELLVAPERVDVIEGTGSKFGDSLVSVLRVGGTEFHVKGTPAAVASALGMDNGEESSNGL